MAILNPTRLSWNDPSAREDGSPFGASDFQAFELGAALSAAGEPEALLSLPVALGAEESPIPDALSSRRHVPQFVAMRTLDHLGQRSVWSNRSEVLFSSRPLAPEDFSAA